MLKHYIQEEREQDLCEKMDCLKLFACDDCSVNFPCVKVAGLQITMIDPHGEEHLLATVEKNQHFRRNA